jgi:hypothetical protein
MKWKPKALKRESVKLLGNMGTFEVELPFHHICRAIVKKCLHFISSFIDAQLRDYKTPYRFIKCSNQLFDSFLETHLLMVLNFIKHEIFISHRI